MCDGHGRIYRCMPQLDLMQGAGQEQGAILDTFEYNEEEMDGNNMEERTEIILATTFMVMVVLSFVAYFVYRCEKNYTRSRLQVNFKIICFNSIFYSLRDC